MQKIRTDRHACKCDHCSKSFKNLYVDDDGWWFCNKCWPLYHETKNKDTTMTNSKEHTTKKQLTPEEQYREEEMRKQEQYQQKEVSQQELEEILIKEGRFDELIKKKVQIRTSEITDKVQQQLNELLDEVARLKNNLGVVRRENSDLHKIIQEKHENKKFNLEVKKTCEEYQSSEHSNRGRAYETECGAKPKHIVLYDSISFIDQVHNALTKLTSLVATGEVEENITNPPPLDSLCELLEKGPQIIREKVDKCLKTIEELHNLLM